MDVSPILIALLAPTLLVKRLPEVRIVDRAPAVGWSRTLDVPAGSPPVLLCAERCTLVADATEAVGLDPVTGVSMWRTSEPLPLPNREPIRLFDFGATLVLAEASPSVRYPAYALGLSARTGRILWQRELDIGANEYLPGSGVLTAVSYDGNPYWIVADSGALAVPRPDEFAPPPPDFSTSPYGPPTLALGWLHGFVSIFASSPSAGVRLAFLRSRGQKFRDAWGGRYFGRPIVRQVFGGSGGRVWVLVASPDSRKPQLAGITPEGDLLPTAPLDLDALAPTATNRGIVAASGGALMLFRNGQGTTLRPLGPDDRGSFVSPAGLLRISTAFPYSVSLRPFGFAHDR